MKNTKGFGMLLALAGCVLGGYLLGQSNPMGFGSGSCPVCQIIGQLGVQSGGGPPVPTLGNPSKRKPRADSILGGLFQ